MATRFGAVSPAQTFATRVRWLVVCLSGIILILVGTVVFLVQNSDKAEGGQVVNTTSSDGQAGPSIDILIASSRIEEGTQISEAMLAPQPTHPDRVPEGALLATDKAEAIGKFAKELLRPGLPINRDQLSLTKPISVINIPPGFRAVTISVDSRSGVEGWAKPGSRVDVLWTYKDESATKVATIVRFTKILSVGGNIATEAGGRAAVANNAATTVTLLVSEKDAKKIELARNLGGLSLSLVGETDAAPRSGDDPDIVDISSIIGTKSEVIVDNEPVAGKMLSRDPKTGKMVSFVLKNNKWVPDTSPAPAAAD